jgi:hypothetical protein
MERSDTTERLAESRRPRSWGILPQPPGGIEVPVFFGTTVYNTL